MRRLGPLSYVFVIALLLLYVPQELAAQSRPILVPANPDSGGPSTGAPLLLRIRPPEPKPAGPEVFYCVTPDTSCRTTQDVFSLAELRDLFVFVVWPGVSGQHVQTVQFFQPDGNLYSATKTRFSVGTRAAVAAAAPAAAASVAPASGNVVAPTPRAPHLMLDANQVHKEGISSLLMRSRGDSAVLTVLPVAGTYITQRNFSGTWHVRVLLNDKLALESAFTLTPAPPPANGEEGTER
jgi:hypothetical protein